MFPSKYPMCANADSIEHLFFNCIFLQTLHSYYLGALCFHVDPALGLVEALQVCTSLESPRYVRMLPIALC